MTIETNFKKGDSVWFINANTLKVDNRKLKGLYSNQLNFPKQLTWELENNPLQSEYLMWNRGNTSRDEDQIFHTKQELLNSL